jgi:hypothetical protein
MAGRFMASLAAFFRDPKARARALRDAFFTWVSPVELGVLALSAALFVWVHASQIEHVFGESDGVRMATDAAGWHFNGRVHLETTDYRMRTSPLYIHALKSAMDHGLRMRALPKFMTWISLVSSLVGLLSTYFLVRSLIGKRGAAIATVLLLLMPAYWLSGSYGMSHGPGLTAMLLALCVFSVALTGERSSRSLALLSGLSALLVFVALSLKADLILNGLAFPGLAFARGKLSIKTFVAGCASVVVGLGLQMAYIRLVVTPVPNPQSAIQFAGAFTERFPFEWRALRVGLGCITHAPGPVLFVVGVLAAAHQLLSRKGFRVAVLSLVWGLPIVLFWGFIIGNSSRHNLSALPPLALVIATFIVSSTESAVRAAALAFMVATANYFSDCEGETGGFGTLVPRTDVLDLTPNVASRSGDTQAWARGFARLKGDKVAIVARWSLPFAVFEALRAHEDAQKLSYDGKDIAATYANGRQVTVKTAYAVTPVVGNAVFREFRDAGYAVWRRDF